MRLKCDYEISGGGSLDLSLSEIDDLTPEGVKRWLLESAQLEIVEQVAYEVRLRPHYSIEKLKKAIEEEKKERGYDPD